MKCYQSSIVIDLAQYSSSQLLILSKIIATFKATCTKKTKNGSDFSSWLYFFLRRTLIMAFQYRREQIGFVKRTSARKVLEHNPNKQHSTTITDTVHDV